MLISDHVKKMNQDLHKNEPSFGAGYMGIKGGGDAFQIHINTIRQFLNKDRKTVLDYGCGKQALAHRMSDVDVRSYDPCVEGVDYKPEPADIVVCLDVMEHIESKYTDNVLKDIASLTKHLCYMCICTTEAKKIYPDGQNTHLNIRDATWWHQKLSEYFDIRTFRFTGTHFIVALKGKMG